VVKNGFSGCDGPSKPGSGAVSWQCGISWTVGDRTSVAATSLDDPLDPAEHPGHARTLCTGLQPDMMTRI